MRLLLILLLSLLLFLGCKKEHTEPSKKNEKHKFITEDFSDEEYSTSDYLMAKPGSWWEYSNGETWTCADKDTVPIFILDYELPSMKFIIKDRVIAPKHPFFGFHKEEHGILNQWYHDETIFQPIYDTVVGQFYSYKQYVGASACSNRHTITETRKVLEKLDSLEINDVTYYDVLRVRHKIRRYYHCKDYGYVPDDLVEFYLAKNVGLIKFSQYNQPGLMDVTLVDHHIQE